MSALGQLLTALATATILMGSNAIIWKVEAATVTGIGNLPLSNSYSPVEKGSLCLRPVWMHLRPQPFPALWFSRLPGLSAVSILRLWLSALRLWVSRALLGRAAQSRRTPRPSIFALAFGEQAWQLGEVACQPPCLIHGQHTSGARVVIVLASIEIGERLPVGIFCFDRKPMSPAPGN